MNQREGSGHYGALLFVYQCTECQGIWVDGDVVAALSHDSAVEAEADVDISEISTEPRETAILCPRCSVNLMEQSGGGLPPGLRVDYCKVCNGFWFDKGELMIYKGHIENKRRKFSKTEQDKRRKKALMTPSPTGNAAVVLKFLNTKVYRLF
jgi:Zn-finger nucleic acid-binding protein